MFVAPTKPLVAQQVGAPARLLLLLPASWPDATRICFPAARHAHLTVRRPAALRPPRTAPLQVDACHAFMGMSKAGFCELTGGRAQGASGGLAGSVRRAKCGRPGAPPPTALPCGHHPPLPDAGSMKPEARKEMWQGGQKRVFFCTPQTYWNDVRRGERLRCSAA